MKVAAAQGQPFGDGPQPSVLDLPRYTLDVALARLRRRNPPHTPWWRRYVRSWSTFEPGDRGADPVDSRAPLVFGLCMAWNEEDVIYATVRNLFIEGADEVLVLDDDSGDDTATEAKAAGATVVHQRSDGAFDEIRRTDQIAALIEERTAATGRPVWWVVVDADEFPRGPGGATIGELARTLPPWVDTVGSRVLEHFPNGRSAPKPRHHPIDELPDACRHDNPSCPAGHWKHQMVLIRRPGELRFMPGRHAIAAPPEGRPVAESTASLLMHHFPLRDRAVTERKFQLAISSSGRYGMSSDEFVKQRTRTRLRMLELAHEGRYEALPNMFPGKPKTGVSVTDWRDLVAPSERALRHEPGLALP